jgi:hypothetical protein
VLLIEATRFLLGRSFKRRYGYAIVASDRNV